MISVPPRGHAGACVRARRAFPSPLRTVALVLAALFAPGAQAEAPGSLRKAYATVHKQADAIVSLRYVMTMSAFGQESRQEMRALGVLVSDDGLILAADAQVNPDPPDRGAGNDSEAAPKMSVKTNEFKTQLPGRDEWLSATMITRDAGLGMAWLRLDEPGGAIAHVDLARKADVAPGDAYFVLGRTGADLGRVPIVAHGFVWGEVQVPRRAFLVGYPQGMAFAADGRIMGFVIPQSRGELRNTDAADRTNALLLIPVEKVASATRRALELSRSRE